jgi:ankyrin repeat protein
LKLLLDNGADVSSRNHSGWTPLISVAGLKRNAPQVRPQIRIKVCRLLFSHDVDIHSRATDNLTALHRAVSSVKDAAVDELLLKHGTDTSLATQTGDCDLHRAFRMTASDERSWACRKVERLSAESLEVVRLLLEYRYGSVVEARGNKLRTPMF